MKKVIIKQFSIDFCGLKGQIAIKTFVIPTYISSHMNTAPLRFAGSAPL